MKFYITPKRSAVRLLLFGLLLISSNVFAQCIINMGYRMSARLPNISQAPDHSGLYLDLYQTAAQRIGCELHIVRESKNRILKHLELGNIDFYPGLSFTQERAEYALFVPNGLPTLYVAITRADHPEIQHLEQIQQETVIRRLGGYMPPINLENNRVKTVPEIPVERVLESIALNEATLYMDELATLSYYLKQSPHQHELRLHRHCCGEIGAFMMGISKASPHAVLINNPNYDSSNPTSENNQQVQLKPETLLWRFSQALQQLSQEGYTAERYQHYYGIDMPIASQ